MKRQLSAFLLLLWTTVLFATPQDETLLGYILEKDNHYWVESGGVTYDVDMTTGTAYVISRRNGLKYSGNVVIAPSVGSFQIPGPYGKYCQGPFPVIGIATHAFDGCTSLTSIEIPSQSTWIESCAFFNCSNLTTVTYTVMTDFATEKFVNDSVFYGCKKLTSISLANGKTTIGTRAFFDCPNLRNINLPDSLQRIEEMAFSGCSGITSITIPEKVNWIANDAFDKGIITDIVIKSQPLLSRWSMRSIFGDRVTRCVIGENITSLGSWSFKNCNKLSFVSIPETVSSIDNDAFSGCSNLSTVIINSNTIVSNSYTSNTSFAKLFGKQVRKFEFGPAISAIGDYALYGCSFLLDITYPSTIKSIGEHAFENCACLTTIPIPDGIDTIKTYTFAGCGALACAEIPESVTRIEPYAFLNCKGLKIVSIPTQVTNLSNVFDGCTNVKQVSWYPIQCVGAPSFGSSVEKFTFGESVKVIPWNICQNMTKLTSIIIPTSVEQIYTGAFDGCSSVTSIKIGSNVRKIGGYAFRGTKISNLVIPDLVDTIGTGAFANSSLLSSVVVGKNLKFIEGAAFANCTNLKTIFNYSNLSFAPHGPQGSISQYATEIYNQMEKIGDYLFANKFGYKLVAYTGNNSEITLPASFRGHEYTIAKGVFTNNQNLLSVTIPNGLTYLGDSVFAGCTNLEEISVPSSVDEIGKYAFSGCTALNKINISGVQLLNQYAFNGCSNLSEIIFGNAINTIGLNAFSGCNNISSITCMASTPPVMADATVSHISPSIPVNIPAIATPAYQAATGWQHFTNFISKGYVAATGISISSSEFNMKIGDEEVLSASVLPADATFKSYSWSVSDPQVAELRSGVVYAKNAGTCVITCTSTDGGYTDSCTITVTANTVLSTGLKISCSIYDKQGTRIQRFIEYNDGDTLTMMESYRSFMTVDVLPGFATNSYVDFSSSDPSVASVELTGNYPTHCSLKADALRAGVSTITLSTMDGTNITKSLVVKVTPDPTVRVIGVVVSPKELDLATGKTDTIRATVLPLNATEQYVSWSSTPWGALSVQNGVITAKSKSGKAIVYCKTRDGSFVDSCIVNIIVPVESITLNETNLELSLNGYPTTATLWSTISPFSASNKNVIWTSEDESVATVSELGLVTAAGPGTTTITCMTEDGGYTASCIVTVTGTVISVTGVSLNKSSLNMHIGDTETLLSTIAPSNAANQNVTWTSSKATVATVSNTGLVTAVGAGSASITCTTEDGGFTASCTVTVNSPVISVTGVSLNKSSLNMYVGDTETLLSTVVPSDATNQNVTWVSSKSAVATVSNTGLVTAVGAGSATITCTTVDGGYSTTCQIKVTTKTPTIENVDLVDYQKNIGHISFTGNVEENAAMYHLNTVEPEKAIKLSNSYLSNGTDYNYVTITPNEGGFEVGDVVKISGYFNNADDSKKAAIAFRYNKEDLEPFYTTENFINGRTMAGTPALQTFVLMQDCDALYLGRSGNTAAYILELIVSRTMVTAIDNMIFATPAEKVLRDGVIYILRDGKLYNVQGMLVR